MTGYDSPRAAQLGFDALLTAADTENSARRFERETGHLPDTMGLALPFYRELIDRHHAAMLSAAVDEWACEMKPTGSPCASLPPRRWGAESRASSPIRAAARALEARGWWAVRSSRDLPAIAVA